MVRATGLGPWEAALSNDHCEEMPTRRCVDLCEYMEDCARYTNDRAQTDEATKAWALDRWGSQSFLMTGRDS